MQCPNKECKFTSEPQNFIYYSGDEGEFWICPKCNAEIAEDKADFNIEKK